MVRLSLSRSCRPGGRSELELKGWLTAGRLIKGLCLDQRQSSLHEASYVRQEHAHSAQGQPVAVPGMEVTCGANFTHHDGQQGWVRRGGRATPQRLAILRKCN